MSSDLPLAERVMKRRRLSRNAKSAYIDLRSLQATSNICERFFSTAGHALTIKRRCLLPSKFEAQLFLFSNKELWSIQDVHSAINKVHDSDDGESDLE